MAQVTVRIYAEKDDGLYLLRCQLPCEAKLRVAMHAWCNHFHIDMNEVHFVFNQRVLTEQVTPWELWARAPGFEVNLLAVPRLDDPQHDVLQLRPPAVTSVLTYVTDVSPDTIEDLLEDSLIIDALRLR